MAWCDARGLESLPAAPATVAAYLGAQARGGKRPSSLGRVVAAIAFAHRTAGHESPTGAELVKRTMRGIRRVGGTAVDRKSPATADRIRVMLDAIPPGIGGLRDRALLLIGFAAALRRSELVALRVEDLDWHEEGLRLRIVRSKTDQEGQGAFIAIPTGRRLKPAAASRDWMAAGGISEGPLFRRVNKAGAVSAEGLTGRTVADVLKKYAAAAGLDPIAFSGHSLRAGFVTGAAKAGATVAKMQAVSRHRSVDVLFSYVRDADEFANHAGEDFL